MKHSRKVNKLLNDNVLWERVFLIIVILFFVSILSFNKRMEDTTKEESSVIIPMVEGYTYFEVLEVTRGTAHNGNAFFHLKVAEHMTDSIDYIVVDKYHSFVRVGDNGYWMIGEDWNGNEVQMVDWL